MEEKITKKVAKRKVKVDGKTYEYCLKAVWLSPEIHKLIKLEAGKLETNMNDVVSMAMIKYFKNN
jgi:hypothetical protein